jgi:transposase
MLRVLYRCVAGLDVHKKTVTATRMRVDEEERLFWETKTFGTMTPELLILHDWLMEWECTHVAMESTGDYWKPIFNVLEDAFEVYLVNAKHVKHVPGRKTDALDSEWLAELMVHGLLKPSFIPPKPQRALRELTRYRTKLVQERSRTVNRVHKLLEGANIKLSSVASDIMGVSGRAMLAAICEGRIPPYRMARLAKGRLRNKIPDLEKALTGIVEPHHRFLLSQQLVHIDFVDEQVTAISDEITCQLERMSHMSEPPGPDADDKESSDDSGADTSSPPLTWQEAVILLDTIPGVSVRTAEVILSEMGLDMSRFPTDKHLAAWAGVAPGNHESAGKRYSGRRRKGNRYLVATLVEAAWSAVRTKNTFLKSRYHRLAARRGKKRAIVAIAHSILVSAWHMLTYRLPYQELGGDFFDQRRKDSKIQYLTRQLEKLTGGSVNVEFQPIAA